jgi:hypothetical protein
MEDEGMSDDLVKLLRGRPLYEGHGEASDLPDDAADLIEAQAARIAALEAEVATAQEQARMASFMGEGYALVEARAIAAEAERDRLRAAITNAMNEIRDYMAETGGTLPLELAMGHLSNALVKP